MPYHTARTWTHSTSNQRRGLRFFFLCSGGHGEQFSAELRRSHPARGSGAAVQYDGVPCWLRPAGSAQVSAVAQPRRSSPRRWAEVDALRHCLSCVGPTILLMRHRLPVLCETRQNLSLSFSFEQLKALHLYVLLQVRYVRMAIHQWLTRRKSWTICSFLTQVLSISKNRLLLDCPSLQAKFQVKYCKLALQFLFQSTPFSGTFSEKKKCTFKIQKKKKKKNLFGQGSQAPNVNLFIDTE